MGDKTGDSETQADWAELTHECLTDILSRLTLEHRWTGPMFACTSWLRASMDPCLNSVFDLETRFDSAPESALWWTPEFERRIDAMLRSVVDWSEGSLTEIRVRHCSDGSLSYAAERCPNLQVLSIKCSQNVTDQSIAKIALGCPKLKEVDISYCFEISHESIALIGQKCPDLRILKRNLWDWLGCHFYDLVPEEYRNAMPQLQDCDSEAAMIGKFMPHLLCLELRCSKLSGKGLVLITKGCLDLDYLDLTRCYEVTVFDLKKAQHTMTFNKRYYFELVEEQFGRRCVLQNTGCKCLESI